ncbi:deoxyhypusine synthase family protein [Candidatus Woesearchaeota archaeon]|nr:deoxyhypusine synthase family protein [Candidatus Woesearchaeota archaeon]
MKSVKQIKIDKNLTVNELVLRFESSGVLGAGKIGKAANIFHDMIKDKECKIFIGAAGPLVPGGLREILIDILESDIVDVFVTTGATLTHDLGEALGFEHLQGHHMMDDKELNKQGYDRVYDSLMQNKIYEAIEKLIKDNFEIFKGRLTIKEFLWKLGSVVKSRSIIKTCYEKKIPLFCPGIADSGIGLMVWSQLVQGKTIDVQVFDDLKEIIDIAWNKQKNGVLYIGGGLPKNYIQQSLQFSKGASYGIQITTDREEPGGSSGAPLREGISWGKLEPDAKFVDVICDATIALPLIWSSVKDKL